ncbi:MAG: hypothetical protein WAN92_09130 [Herbaspirillum sp.]
MKYRPILFSGPMVLAILEGRKTQTRRVVKPAIVKDLDFLGGAEYPDEVSVKIGAGYGQPGDKLWVRETWQYVDWTNVGQPYIGYKADGKRIVHRDVPEEWSTRLEDIWRHLSKPENFDIDNRAADRRWCPSIYMPRWASRITLEITHVQIERLQAINEMDARAEGVYLCSVEGGGYKFARGEQEYDTAVKAYRELWDDLNAARGYGWNTNPWVWVLEFRRVE